MINYNLRHTFDIVNYYFNLSAKNRGSQRSDATTTWKISTRTTRRFPRCPGMAGRNVVVAGMEGFVEAQAWPRATHRRRDRGR